jgi:putative ABC transport system permease protein
MFKNYLKIALRNLRRNKLRSFINVFGLAIGLATCMLIIFYVGHELGFDRFHEKAGRIVRVCFQGEVQGQKMQESTVMAPVAAAMVSDFSEVEQATRIRFASEKSTIVCNGNTFRDNAFALVDANFFQVFTLPFLKGDQATALSEPNCVVLSESTAKKYFGNSEPLGTSIRLKNETTAYKVTGVIRDIPENAHFQFDLLGSMVGLPEAKEDNWMSSNFYTYLLLREGTDYKSLAAKMPLVVEKYIGPQLQQGLGQTLAEFRKSGNDIGFRLQPLTDIHLSTEFPDNLSPRGNARFLYIFSSIAVFMLLIACINFMNLSTASAAGRAKEVGLRKVMGSQKSALAKQFLMESLLTSTVALLLAFVLIQPALPFFNRLTGQNLSFRPLDQPYALLGLVGLALLTGLLAGSYPAFYLSSFTPSAVLKGKLTKGKEGAAMRSGLVVVQFFIAIVLIVSTTVVYRQLAFIQHKDLGYNKNQVLVLSNVGQLGNKMDAFRARLENDPRIESVACSGYLPAGPSNNNNFFVTSGKNPGEIAKTLRYDVDEKYIPVLGLQLKSGRNFSTAFSSDSNAVILNEAAVKVLGFGENALNETIVKTLKSGEKQVYTVIGVVKDFHFRSLYEHISPLVMAFAPDKSQLVVKVKTPDASSLTAELGQWFAALGPEDPLVFSFLDERHSNMYQTEQNTGRVLALFAGLTIFVACLGLFGLMVFMAHARTREIGIRKVLGASVAGITALLAKDFLKLVLIAIVIASPVAWYFMNKWLSDFAYRIDIEWWMFALAGALAVLIAFLTVGFQSVRAALANPVKSLRSE